MPKIVACDGQTDCSDASDELGCGACREGWGYQSVLVTRVDSSGVVRVEGGYQSDLVTRVDSSDVEYVWGKSM